MTLLSAGTSGALQQPKTAQANRDPEHVGQRGQRLVGGGEEMSCREQQSLRFADITARISCRILSRRGAHMYRDFQRADAAQLQLQQLRELPSKLRVESGRKLRGEEACSKI
jgi:hypothetical protein